MFELTFLGTSASAPSIHRGLSAQVVKHDEYRFLIDCGEGTQRQILKSGLGFKRLNRVFITHGHLDHILGLGGLLSTFMRWETIDDIEIFGGRSALARVRDLLFKVVLRGAETPVELRFREIQPGIIFEADDFSVTAFQVFHRGPDCYGYRFEEKPRRPFLPEVAENLQIPAGPWRRDLVAGKSVNLPDGRVIYPDQVLGPEQTGTKFVHVGDVGRVQALYPHILGADTLVIEATYLEEDADMAARFGHLTAQQAARVALDAGVKQLILTHISRRYRERDVLAEARSIFPNSRVARDFDTYQVKRGQCLKRIMRAKSTPSFHETDQNQVLLRRLVSVILRAVLFTLAYAQSPLYTSNQNQYFLHGLAKAGLGNLNRDWLVNTLDPTPIFSTLIYLTGKYLPWAPIYYLYYSLLAGIYIFSLYGLLSDVFHIKYSWAKRWFYLAVMFLIHSAALRYLVVRVFDPNWAYLFDGGVAGQRLLGSVLQPSTFGVLFILSIFLYLRGKTLWAVLCLVLVPTVHPTYLLSASILTLVYMGILASKERNLRDPLILGAAALLGVTPTLVQTFRTFGGTGRFAAARSRELLVTFRIPHHAIPAEWFDGSVVFKVVVILFALYLTRKTRFFHILCWPFAAAVTGTILQILTDSDVLALLFPWRLSTWLVPLGVASVAVWALERFWPRLEAQFTHKTIMAASLSLTILLAGAGLAKTVVDFGEKKNSSDRPMMAFVTEHKSPDDVYLIPIDMQDFRLETGAPVYVEFKTPSPDKDKDVLEWYQRVATAGSLYQATIKRTGCQILAQLYAEGVTHAVLPYDHTVKNCPNLEILYVDLDYQVYKITAAEVKKK